jgi:plasmid stabilization system protein ParE
LTRLEIAPRAERQIRRIQAWWRVNRPAAPTLFAEELADALESVTALPSQGTTYRELGGVPIRRLLLHRSRYHILFSFDTRRDVVSLRAVWREARGRPSTKGRGSEW